MSSNSAFLKEMGITEWTSRDGMESHSITASSSQPVVMEREAITATSAPEQVSERASSGLWWFFGNTPKGDAEILLQNIVRVLGLSPQEWSWKSPADSILPEQLPQDGTPIVALAFGGSAAQKLSGERDSLPELRQTVLAIDADGAEDVPLIATFELGHLASRPKDKALFWQDLLLAKSVLQNT
ncbi:hypothetical protein [Polynucleobacter sp. AP-Nino-20-G2]|uniref:hypothetical protein n=1 Tax=Polynucleobacter sp. AP-Nino-20-G2 TaxID=2576917 RepID=UPI001BFD16DB|nr:hypothetical protein [Polynucleobacter sp. AP-Nino-20-G2]QWE17565.1 hypothetical protein FD960_05045 [Polynucleobacter sp. AP-Nino-20-G2]